MAFSLLKQLQEWGGVCLVLLGEGGGAGGRGALHGGGAGGGWALQGKGGQSNGNGALG